MERWRVAFCRSASGSGQGGGDTFDVGANELLIGGGWAVRFAERTGVDRYHLDAEVTGDRLRYLRVHRGADEDRRDPVLGDHLTQLRQMARGRFERGADAGDNAAHQLEAVATREVAEHVVVGHQHPPGRGDGSYLLPDPPIQLVQLERQLGGAPGELRGMLGIHLG